MHRTSVLATIGVAVLALVTAPLGAAPTLLGPTGLLIAPSADTVETARAQLGGWLADDVANSVSLNAGIGPGLEVTGAWVDPDHGDGEGILSAKWRFRQSSLASPAVAVGVIDVADQLDLTPYIVVQKGFEVGGNGITALVGYANSDSLLDGVFAGAEMTINERYKVMVEYDGDDLNAGVRFPYKEKLDITAGVVRDGLAVSAAFRIW